MFELFRIFLLFYLLFSEQYACETRKSQDLDHLSKKKRMGWKVHVPHSYFYYYKLSFFLFRVFFRIALTSKRFCERALVFVKRTSKKSWKRLQSDNFSSSKTSWRCLEDIFKTCLRYVLQKPLQDVFQDVFKTYLQDVLRPFEDVLKISCNYVLKTSSRRLQYVFTKTNVCWERKWIACLNSFLVKVNPCSSAVRMFNQLEAYRNPGLLQSLMTCW